MKLENKLYITNEDAKEAFVLIYSLIKEAFEDRKYTATQINVPPSTVKEMYNLIKKVEAKNADT